MARRESKPATHLLMLAILLFFMFQSKAASRFGTNCLACRVDEGTRTQKLADMEDDSGDGNGDYDYYRRYGDVPSPGIGH
ncbi:hypothetical protein OIU76_023203 [Salix suchowensis]|uniref:Uncharacterized protein n=1 Tax=Salix suchowensis TaxID=1278906 RepID=A0ABQ9ALK6_9ROSI|nr:hypothetical protein OIU76_023203 [Salix suchowensis]KAJ6348617.1 hypothetical protein OIU77_006235 [Salix suchowensis]